MPATAASSGDLPRAYSLATLSATTMASSIRMPIAISSPTIEIMLMLTPSTFMTTRPPMNDTGSPITIQNV